MALVALARGEPRVIGHDKHGKPLYGGRVPYQTQAYAASVVLDRAYGKAPQYQAVHGAYNHGWLIGDESAISPATQAEIDAMLEIVPAKVPSEQSTPAAP